jgi:hypothetical protein
LRTSPTPSRLRTPRLRLAVVSLCLVAQAFALVHLFAVRHVRCAEHGEMVHVEREPREPAALAARAQATQDLEEASAADVVRPTGLAIEAHQDDHCMALSERRDLRTLEVQPLVSAPQALAEVTYLHRAPAFVARALYRLAPKISPPAIG